MADMLRHRDAARREIVAVANAYSGLLSGKDWLDMIAAMLDASNLPNASVDGLQRALRLEYAREEARLRRDMRRLP